MDYQVKDVTKRIQNLLAGIDERKDKLTKSKATHNSLVIECESKIDLSMKDIKKQETSIDEMKKQLVAELAKFDPSIIPTAEVHGRPKIELIKGPELVKGEEVKKMAH